MTTDPLRVDSVAVQSTERAAVGVQADADRAGGGRVNAGEVAAFLQRTEPIMMRVHTSTTAVVDYIPVHVHCYTCAPKAINSECQNDLRA